MAIIKNEDLKIMVEVEELLHKKLVETNGIKDDNGGYYFDENDEECNIWVSYWNLVERLIVDKQKSSQKANEYNKRNKEYHRIMNNICSSKKSGNIEKVEYWQNELKKMKEGAKNE